jgi:radical SAM superfamily enzyme YgiQ (UPF0313 family)/ubiquinone/menaquinone biosynthesis C-methylase UbiE
MGVRKNPVILVNIYNVWRSPAFDRRIPLGMLYLGASLKKAGYPVKAYHFLEEDIDNYLNRIVSDEPLFVAVTSIMTGFSLRAAIRFSQGLKSRCSSIPIVWGGTQPSAIPDICLKEDYVDGVGIGEGEETIVEIAKAYQEGTKFSDIKGFAYKNSSNDISMNEERRFIKELDSISPDYSLINLQDYIFNDGQITGVALSSRGCPYDCSFCYNNSFNNRRWRTHSEEFVVNNILELRKSYHFSNISFSDDNFLVDKRRAFSILEKLHKKGIRVFSIDLRIKGLSEEDVEGLKEYEVISVFFGAESLNSRLLGLIQKEHKKEDVIDGLVKLDKYPNINAQSEILIGLPFETKEEMIQDIRDGFKLYNYHRNFSLYFGVLFPLPKTKMFEYAKANGFNPSSLQDYAEIDLNSAWKICDGWIPWADKLAKRQLFWTEKFSEIIPLNRINRNGIVKEVFYFADLIQFNVAKFRLARQFFTGAQIDFFVYRMRHRIKTLPVLILESARELLNPVLSIDQRVDYRNFGYIPTGSIRDVWGKLFGYRNLLKRLQAKDIMRALNIQTKDFVLDFGCGSGYMTVEMAKLAQKTYGIDIVDDVETIRIPKILKGRLEFIKASGTKLPFRENFFDKILASEVLPMIPDPTQFLFEMKRVLKPGGLLVIVNGGGHPTIKEAFEKKSLLLRILVKIYSGRVPNSYEAYCSILQNSFKTAQDHFFEEKDIRHLIRENHFDIESIDYSPGHWAGTYFSWSQFLLYLKTGRTLSQHGFILKYYLFTLLRWFENRKYQGGIICVARKR